jgi:hypothetical protein
MSGVFQNVDPPPPHRPASVYPPPRLWCGGRTHSLGGEGVGGQEFGRRQTLLCTLYYTSTLCFNPCFLSLSVELFISGPIKNKCAIVLLYFLLCLNPIYSADLPCSILICLQPYLASSVTVKSSYLPCSITAWFLFMHCI